MATMTMKALHEAITTAVQKDVKNKPDCINLCELVLAADPRVKYSSKQVRDFFKQLDKAKAELGEYLIGHTSLFDAPLVERPDGSRSTTFSYETEDGEKRTVDFVIGAGEPKRSDGGLLTQDFLQSLADKDPELVTSKFSLSRTHLNEVATTDEELDALGLRRDDKYSFTEVEALV